VAGTDTNLSKQGVRWTEVGRQSADRYTLGVLGASLFYYYDSLIEKCSTLSVVRAPADP
jgi:hypothetical protein